MVHGVHTPVSEQAVAATIPDLSSVATVPGYYRWVQSLDEVGVSFLVPEGTRGRDLAVTFRKGAVAVLWKRSTASEPLLSGATLCDVVPDGCSWTLEGGSCVLVLQKARRGLFWRCVSEGHCEVVMPDWWPHTV